MYGRLSALFLATAGLGMVTGITALQPLSAQFHPEARGYAVGYGYGYGAASPVAVGQVGTAVSKTVHYADRATVVGYAPSAVYKPDLSAYAAASFPLVEQLRRFDPVVRPVHTVVPKVTAVEPSVSVHKYAVDVPIEYGPPTVVVQQTDGAHESPYYYQVVDRKK